MLANNCLRYIQYIMKDIHVVPLHYVFLEFLWNEYFILVRYKFYRIPASSKITLLYSANFIFSDRKGYFFWYRSTSDLSNSRISVY